MIANMIGAGVFTSLGFQLSSVSNTWTIILLWGLGAVMALFGAFSYAEIGTELRRSGGEYHFLTELFSPLIGYLSGWISMTVGFAAPIALAAIALSKYLEVFHGISISFIAIITIVIVSLFHAINIKSSAKFQNVTTALKVFLIFIFIVFGFLHVEPINALEWSNNWRSEILYPGFAVSFVYVTYSYSGWNAAAYIIDEIKNPAKNLPRALILGTLIVSTIYILLNLVFLKNASLDELQGQLEVGQIVSNHIFGIKGGKIMSLAIGIMLISSISAMTWIGPRVIKTMAEDHSIWRYFKKVSTSNIPVRAIILQSGIAIFMIITGTFEQILIYCGFLLNLFAALTVYGSFIIRKKSPYLSYKSPLYPIPQIIFLILSLWIMIYLIIQQPYESLMGLMNIVLGYLSYYLSQRIIID